MSSHILGFGKLRTALLAALLLLLPAPAFAGTCVSGPDNGKTCFSSNDCRHFCSGGPSANQTCFSSSDCQRSCSGGIDAGRTCVGDSSCRHTCVGGTRAGLSCISNGDCTGGGACFAYTCLSYGCLASTCSGSASLSNDPPLDAVFGSCRQDQPARSTSAR
jgi:hypothetical protein